VQPDRESVAIGAAREPAGGGVWPDGGLTSGRGVVPP
jgi:hypothetical protein